MDILSHILGGFQVALQPANFFYCLVGVLLGTLIGVLPGIGPGATIALIMPITFYISPTSAIIMLAGIYYGAMYGGSTTSILVNIPGEAASAITCLDGYQMARKGRAGPALGIAAFGSLIAGTLSTIALMILAHPLAGLALKFGPPEYFSLLSMGLALLAYLSQGSRAKGFMMAFLGLILSYIGLDTITGSPRFTLGYTQLLDGIDFVPLIIGLFGISEVLVNLEGELGGREVFKTSIKRLLPTLQDWRDSILPILRGSIVGFFLGILPGGGATISSIVSYGIEKKISKTPKDFGTGVIQGVAAPESSNNAAVGGCFIPLFSLGIPSNAVIALILGGLMIHGIRPGPLLLEKSPEIFWGFVASMYIGNVLLLLLNLPLIGIWVRLLRISYRMLFPFILLFCVIGSFSLDRSLFDVGVMVFFGVIGYCMKKLNYEAAPLIMAFVLGPMFEEAFRQSLIISRGNFFIFFNRPISRLFLLLTLLILVSGIFPYLKKLLRI